MHLARFPGCVDCTRIDLCHINPAFRSGEYGIRFVLCLFCFPYLSLSLYRYRTCRLIRFAAAHHSLHELMLHSVGGHYFLLGLVFERRDRLEIDVLHE
jgi:hypothetical protein